MKLYDYLILTVDGTELTVWDKDYDTELYFYNDSPDEDDRWQTSMLELTEILTVIKIREKGLEVNLSDVISNKIDKLKEANLFIHYDINSIMDDMENILSGHVSEEWLEKFVNVLKEN